MSPSYTSASEMGNSHQSAVGQEFWSSENDWLHKCLSDLAPLDLASKAGLLQSLSSYLSCVAATMSTSTDVEVIKLHEVLVGELQNHTEFLASRHSKFTSTVRQKRTGRMRFWRGLCISKLF